MHSVQYSLTLDYGMLSSCGETSNTTAISSFLCVIRLVKQKLASIELRFSM